MNTIARTNLFAITVVFVAAVMAVAYATPASAYGHRDHSSGDNSSIEVSNDSNATVNNTVDVKAETGDNTANGGNGDDGGNGGDASGDGSNTGGRGGNGGAGGIGGIIVTGDATAFSSVANDVNSNRTVIDTSCGCSNSSHDWFSNFRSERQSGTDNSIEVSNDNHATVNNTVDVKAETGDNTANGGNGEDGGNGGDARGAQQHQHQEHNHWFWNQDQGGNGDNTGGAGGNGGNGGGDGQIQTGNSASGSDLVNVVNQNVTRITRG
jgi:hypothetical protein